jgi:hypothetical protein
MKLKMAADRVLKRFWRENRKEDAFKVTYKSTTQVSRNFHALFTKTLA